MCFVDLEPCSVWHEREQKARKGHRCDCCGTAILPGQLYLSHFSVFEGAAAAERMCLACRDDRQVFAAAHDGTLCSPGWLVTVLGDCIADDDPDSRRWVEMRQRIRGRIGGR